MPWNVLEKNLPFSGFGLSCTPCDVGSLKMVYMLIGGHFLVACSDNRLLEFLQLRIHPSTYDCDVNGAFSYVCTTSLEIMLWISSVPITKEQRERIFFFFCGRFGPKNDIKNRINPYTTTKPKPPTPPAASE